MGNRYLLDCTLRDGGYLNDWNFGHNNLVSIFERIVDANIDFIEIGFLDDRRKFDINRSIMPDSDSVAKIYGNLERKKTKIIGMIDYGTCNINNIKPQKECFLDGIRVIFKKHLKKEAFEYCRQLKDLGYLVFAQLVSVTSYSDDEMMDLIKLANNVKPYAVSIVDTYGLMHQDNLLHYYDLLNKNLDININLGYHGHNNFQMGYANCITMLNNITDRDLIVDGSLHGMGKSAGNAPIELVSMYMNKNLDKDYDINQLMEAIDANISQFFSKSTWGYNVFYFIAAFNDCHPNYVDYLMNKKTLSVKSVNDILSRLKGEDKLLYDKKKIEALYLEYQTKEVNDSDNYNALSQLFNKKTILLLGPGRSILDEENIINEYINKNKPLVVSINFISKYSQDYIFLTNSKRYVQLSNALTKGKYKIIATSNITETGKNSFDYFMNYSNLIDPDTEIVDNSLIMALRMLLKLGCKNIALAGFDGYKIDVSNYYDEKMEYNFIKEKHNYLNNYVKKYLADISDKVDVQFVTKSIYNEA